MFHRIKNILIYVSSLWLVLISKFCNSLAILMKSKLTSFDKYDTNSKKTHFYVVIYILCYNERNFWNIYIVNNATTYILQLRGS